LNPWYLYFWEIADKYDLLASTVTELSSAVGAVDANAVPAAITTRDSTTSKSSSKRKQRGELRTPKRKGRGSISNDDVSASSALSEEQQAELTSAFVTLGKETKMSRIEQHVSTLRLDARAINNRIAELKGIMYKHELDALETKSREKIALFQRIVADYATEMTDLRNQLSDIMTTMVKDQETKLHE
jgi:phage I-like protein